MDVTEHSNTQKLYRIAFALSIFTVIYNLLEGGVSVFFGYEDDTLTLFGFGLDSFIETISAIGIAHMVIRIARNPNTHRDEFEKTALKITGYSFYALCIILFLMAIQKVVMRDMPATTFWGIIISSISIAIMLVTIYWKISLGKKLNSAALIADANCAKVCVYMSLVLLASSLLYEFLRVPYIDIAGTLGIIWFSFTEGRECFEKAEGLNECNSKH